MIASVTGAPYTGSRAIPRQPGATTREPAAPACLSADPGSGIPRSFDAPQARRTRKKAIHKPRPIPEDRPPCPNGCSGRVRSRGTNETGVRIWNCVACGRSFQDDFAGKGRRRSGAVEAALAAMAEMVGDGMGRKAAAIESAQTHGCGWDNLVKRFRRLHGPSEYHRKAS